MSLIGRQYDRNRPLDIYIPMLSGSVGFEDQKGLDKMAELNG